jgi:hypothetical protein
MEAAPDLRDAVVTSFATFSAGDLAAFLDHLSRQPGTHVLGTDAGEWWADPAALRQGGQDSLGLTVLPGQLQAWREGSVGWVVSPDARFRRADGGEVPVRYTGVYRLEDGEWRLVQGHWSIGVPNVEAGLVSASSA